MPAAPPVAYATLSNPLPSRPYIFSITPSPSGHLLLRHPSSDITIADPQSLQPIDKLSGGHEGHVTDISVDETAIWSSGKDGKVVRWDERSRRAASSINAFVRKTLPVLAVAASERDHLVIGGTELVSAEAHILFWDTRNTKEPAYLHSSTHSDDITHLSLLPSTNTFLASSSSAPIRNRLLLSSSTDGLVALSNMMETDEENAVLAEENWGQSIANAGSYLDKGQMRIWARSDMDAMCTWRVGTGEEGELELQDQEEFGSENFKFREFELPKAGPSVVQTAQEEQQGKESKLKSDYLIDVVPSLGVSAGGMPIAAVGTNECVWYGGSTDGRGDIIVQHYASSSTPSYQPSGYFMAGPKGHKDVVRAFFHDVTNEAVYTGSEDGVLAGWSLPSLGERIRVGDPEVDDDGGDGREDVDSEDEESEIETEESESDGMDVDDDEEEDEVKEPGPRHGPVLGRGADERKEKRKGKRVNPY